MNKNLPQKADKKSSALAKPSNLAVRPLNPQEVRLRPAPVWSRALAWTIIGSASFAFVFACFAKIDEVVLATGELQPLGAEERPVRPELQDEDHRDEPHAVPQRRQEEPVLHGHPHAADRRLEREHGAVANYRHVAATLGAVPAEHRRRRAVQLGLGFEAVQFHASANGNGCGRRRRGRRSGR